MYDVKDGIASNSAWMAALPWSGQQAFSQAKLQLWNGTDGRPAGWRRLHGPLTHVALKGAGHMVPQDQPENALLMLETWVNEAVLGGKAPQGGESVSAGGRAVAPPG